MDEGSHERVLGEILGVGGSEQSPAEAMDGAVKAEHELLKGRRIAVAGATRKLELCSPVVRIRTLRRHTPRCLPREYGRRPRIISGSGCLGVTTGRWQAIPSCPRMTARRPGGS